MEETELQEEEEAEFWIATALAPLSHTIDRLTRQVVAMQWGLVPLPCPPEEGDKVEPYEFNSAGELIAVRLLKKANGQEQIIYAPGYEPQQ
jgi:hypothetical protein